MAEKTLYTIGFTRKTAERFFTLLQQAGVRRVLDVRLNSTSQLAGFAKREDLPFFLDRITGIGYRAVAELAPTQELIDLARKKKAFVAFEEGYRRLIEERRVERAVAPADLDRACLLCSEDTPEHCHRRIAAEYLAEKLGGMRIVHLV